MDLSHEQDQYTAKVKENQQKVKHFKNQVKVEGCGSGTQHAGHTAIQYLTMGSSCSLTSLCPSLSLSLPLLPPSLPLPLHPSPSPSLPLPLHPSPSLYIASSPLFIPLRLSLSSLHPSPSLSPSTSLHLLPSSLSLPLPLPPSPSLSLSLCVRYRWPNSTLRIPLQR